MVGSLYVCYVSSSLAFDRCFRSCGRPVWFAGYEGMALLQGGDVSDNGWYTSFTELNAIYRAELCVRWVYVRSTKQNPLLLLSAMQIFSLLLSNWANKCFCWKSGSLDWLRS